MTKQVVIEKTCIKTAPPKFAQCIFGQQSPLAVADGFRGKHDALRVQFVKEIWGFLVDVDKARGDHCLAVTANNITRTRRGATGSFLSSAR